MVVNETGRGKIEAIHTSPGGVPKLRSQAANIIADRIEGDAHDDNTHHGGPDRAVCLYSRELIEALRAEGHPIFPGSTGENIMVAGIQWDQVVPGCRFVVGTVELEVTGYAAPCKTIRNSFTDGYFNRISQKLSPGWSRVYTRVINPGRIRVGDEILLKTPISY